MEEAVDIIVRHGFATTDASVPPNVGVSVTSSGGTINVSTSDGATTGSTGPNSIDNTAGSGAGSVSVQASVAGGTGSGIGASTAEHSLLPDMDVFNLSGGIGASKLKKKEDPPPSQEEQDDNAALFYRLVYVVIEFETEQLFLLNLHNK